MPARRLLLGVLLTLSGAELPAAESRSIADLQTAALQGDKVAQTLLAGRYELADGIERDFFQSNYLYCQAARGGHAEAQVRLGLIYAHGRAVAKNPRIAAGLFSLAATQGHEHAKRLLQFMVGQERIEPDLQIPECVPPERPLMLRLTTELPPGRRADTTK